MKYILMLIFIVGQSLGIYWWWNNYRGQFRHLLHDYRLHKENVLPFAKKVVFNYGLTNNFGQSIYEDELLKRVVYYFERDCHECRGKFEFQSKWKKFHCEEHKDERSGNPTGKLKCWVQFPTGHNWIFQNDPEFDKYVFSSWFCTDIQSSNPACVQENIS